MEFKEITDKYHWNNFVEGFPWSESGVPRATFIQSFEWIDFQKSLGKEAYAFGVTEGDNLTAAAAVVVVKAKRGKYLYIRNGPVLDWNNKELMKFLMDKLKEFAKSKGLWFARISPLIETGTSEEQALRNLNGKPNPMHDVDALDTWLLDVRKEEEEILKDAKKKNRYEIRKSLSEGEDGLNLEVEISGSSEKIEDFYSILNDTVQRQKWNAYSLDYIKNEFDAFAKDNRSTLILVKKDGVNIAGGIFIHYAHQTTYHYGASLSEYNKIPGPYRVIWEALREAKKRQIPFLNFWGISPENKPDHPWVGLTRFKMKFPGFAQRWTHSIDIPLSPFYYFTNTIERIDKNRKGY